MVRDAPVDAQHASAG